jgi:hypothetical protein
MSKHISSEVGEIHKTRGNTHHLLYRSFEVSVRVMNRVVELEFA